MRVSTASDPRLEAMFGSGSFSEESERPVVALRRSRIAPWMVAALIGTAALLLFLLLGAHPTKSIQGQAGAGTSAFPVDPPPLTLPSQFAQPSYPPDRAVAAPPSPLVAPPRFAPQIAPKAFSAPRPMSFPSRPFAAGAPSLAGQQGGAAMVIDSSGPPSLGMPPVGGVGASGGAGNPLQAGNSAVTVKATRLANPSDTIPQGVIIPAVLETAFHSTSAGYARAIVSRDVRGFDGTRILIPRGSRLIGEYRGNVQPGQDRAVINWTRLIRGDGVTISLDSPATDPLGGGGVRAHVNTHLLERITDTLLQSTVGRAGNLIGPSRNTVLVGLPGAAEAATDRGEPAGNSMRTLSVPAGTSISVFVAQDLEFPDDTANP